MSGGATSRRSALLLVLLPAGLLLTGAAQAWVAGTVDDPVFNGATVSGTGAQVAPGVLAFALVCGAAVVAVLTGGRIVRRAAATALVVSALAVTVTLVVVLADPGAALGRQAAASVGRTGSLPATAHALPWVWVALVAGLCLLGGSVLAWRGAGQWGGLTSRYDLAGDERGVRRTDWDEVSEGRDPTADDHR